MTSERKQRAPDCIANGLSPGDAVRVQILLNLLLHSEVPTLIGTQNASLNGAEAVGDSELSRLRSEYIAEFVFILRSEKPHLFTDEAECELVIRETIAIIDHITDPDHLGKTLLDQNVQSVFLFHPRQILTTSLAGVLEETELPKKVKALSGNGRVQFGDEAAIFSVVNKINQSSTLPLKTKRRLMDLATLIVNTLPAFIAGIGQQGPVRVALVCIPISLEQALISGKAHPKDHNSFYRAPYNVALVQDTLEKLFSVNGRLTLGLGAMTPGMIRKNPAIMELLQAQEHSPRIVDGHAGTVALMIMNIEEQLKHNQQNGLPTQEVDSIGVVGVGQIGSLFIRSYLQFLKDKQRKLPSIVYLNDVKKKHRHTMLRELKTDFPEITFEVGNVKTVMKNATIVVAATNQRRPYTVTARPGQILLDDGQPNAWQSVQNRKDVVWPTGGLDNYERAGISVLRTNHVDDDSPQCVVGYSTQHPYDWGGINTALPSLSAPNAKRLAGMFGCELQNLVLALAISNYQFIDEPVTNRALCERIVNVMQSDATKSTTVEQVLETIDIFAQIGIRVNPMLSRVV